MRTREQYDVNRGATFKTLMTKLLVFARLRLSCSFVFLFFFVFVFQPNDFYALHGGFEALAATLVCFTGLQFFLVFNHAASEGGAGACSREILVFSRSFH